MPSPAISKADPRARVALRSKPRGIDPHRHAPVRGDARQHAAGCRRPRLQQRRVGVGDRPRRVAARPLTRRQPRRRARRRRRLGGSRRAERPAAAAAIGRRLRARRRAAAGQHLQHDAPPAGDQAAIAAPEQRRGRARPPSEPARAATCQAPGKRPSVGGDALLRRHACTTTSACCSWKSVIRLGRIEGRGAFRRLVRDVLGDRRQVGARRRALVCGVPP